MSVSPVEKVKNKRQRIVAEIAKLERSLQALKHEEAYAATLTEKCPSCSGSGEESYTDAAGSRDWRSCSTCKGWGYIQKEISCPSCTKDLTEMVYLRRNSYVRCPFCGEYIGNLFEPFYNL